MAKPRWMGWVVVSAALCAAPVRAADIALVAQINGAPTLTRGAKTEPLQRGAALAAGDVVETDASSKAKLLLVDDSVLAIGPKSRVQLDAVAVDAAKRTLRMQVAVGRFKLAIAKFFGGATEAEIRTPTSVIGVRGTVLWGDTDLDAICALDGTIEVRALTGSADPARLGAGECVTRMAAGKTDPLKPTAEDLAAYLREVTLE